MAAQLLMAAAHRKRDGLEAMIYRLGTAGPNGWGRGQVLKSRTCSKYGLSLIMLARFTSVLWV